MAGKSKVTIVPLRMTKSEVGVPVMLMPDLAIENAARLLTPEHFALWRNSISQEEANNLADTSVGIINRFNSPGHVGREESDSERLVHETFVALRLVKPTRCRYSSIQATIKEDGSLDVFSFTARSEKLIQVPEVEAINSFETRDFLYLASFLPKFRSVWSDGPVNIRRGIRYFEMAYVEVSDPVLQFLTRMMGIEAVFSINEKPLPQRDVADLIRLEVGAASNIYENYPAASYFHVSPVLVGDLVDDLFKLRNELIHGGWMPDWKDGLTRPSIAGQVISHPELVMATASFVLRKLLLKKIEEMSEIH